MPVGNVLPGKGESLDSFYVSNCGFVWERLVQEEGVLRGRGGTLIVFVGDGGFAGRERFVRNVCF